MKNQHDTSMTTILQNLTPEERDLLDTMIRLEGREWVEQRWQSILNQARAAGDLD